MNVQHYVLMVYLLFMFLYYSRTLKSVHTKIFYPIFFSNKKYAFYLSNIYKIFFNKHI